MKNRNPLKLEKQQKGSDKAYRSRRRNVNKLLVRLDVLLRDSDEDFAKDSKNYGHAGSMAHIEVQLIEAVDFLSDGKGVERV